jgi:hypothetical protein
MLDKILANRLTLWRLWGKIPVQRRFITGGKSKIKYQNAKLWRPTKSAREEKGST